MQGHRVVVIGGNNVDITATAYTTLVYGDSNPGRVHTGLGGVGRNIAENLARLSQEVHFISAFGDDQFSFLAKQQAEGLGMDISDSLFVPNARSSTYICVTDPNGEMSVAVSDMDICDRLTPDFLRSKLDLLLSAEAIVVDANLPEETIEYVTSVAQAPVFADTVSAKKASRLRSSLPRLGALKANRIETELLSGIAVSSNEDARMAAELLHRQGVRNVYITLGEHGAFASNGVEAAFEKPLAHRIVNTTGCGDAFIAASVVARLEQLSCRDALRFCLAASAVCALCDQSVAPNMSLTEIQHILDQEVAL